MHSVASIELPDDVDGWKLKPALHDIDEWMHLSQNNVHPQCSTLVRWLWGYLTGKAKGSIAAYFVWILLLCLCPMANSFTCLVTSKPVKQKVSRRVILPLPMVSVLWWLQFKLLQWKFEMKIVMCTQLDCIFNEALMASELPNSVRQLFFGGGKVGQPENFFPRQLD